MPLLNVQNRKFYNLLHPLSSTLTLISLLLFSYSMFKSIQNELHFGNLGLFSFLPLTYFFSIVTLTISFLISLYLHPKTKFLLMLQCFGLISFLFLMPLIVEGTVRFNSSFVIGGEIDYLLRNSFLNSEIVRYNNWPGADIFGASFVLITNININKLLLFTPYVSQIICFLIIFSFFNIIFNGGRKLWLSCWIFFIGNWLNQDYYSPQNMAFLLYLVFLLLMFKLIIKNINHVSNKLSIFIVFLSIVTTHALTPFIAILHMLSVQIIEKTHKINKNNFLLLLFFMFIIYSAWQILGAHSMFSKVLTELQYSDLKFTSGAAINRISTGSASHLFIALFRTYFGLSFYLLAFIGIISSIKQVKDAIPSIMILFVITTSGLLVAGGYGGEIVIRILLFGLIPLSYFISQNLEKKHTTLILIIFLIVSPFLHIIGHYGSETIDYTAPDDLKGANFFFTHTTLNDSSIRCYSDSLSSSAYIEKFKSYDSLSYPLEHNSQTQNNYIWLTRRSDEAATFIGRSKFLFRNKIAS